MTVAKVNLWDKTIGTVAWDADKEIANFEYEPPFIKSGIQLAPFEMRLSDEIFSFPTLNKKTFKGLPGLLADSLPDKFGNALINEWLTRQGKTEQSFNPVDRLCYIGTRGMGALEFSPVKGPPAGVANKIDLDELVKVASDILAHKEEMSASFSPEEREAAMRDILRIGTSAGGARAKAIIAWNEQTQEVRSGQVSAGEGYSYWILKFDGVEENKDKELADPQGYGLIEYAYYKMALAAGIEMSECRILSENHRNHFMTRRFDRTDTGGKIHMQSLCAIRHYDFNLPGAYSYEQALQTIRDLGLPMHSIEEQFRRMAFNVLARNQDDHVKNIAFLMDQQGNWTLSPAYDVIYSYNPEGQWTAQHQMTLNGKRRDFEWEDFRTCAANAAISKVKAKEIMAQVQSALLEWGDFAASAGVPGHRIQEIDKELIRTIKIPS